MCQNANLQDLIESTVNDFIKDELLFTALDVSNKVKESMPFARHREVRDHVRSIWLSNIEPNGYGRSPIVVTLPDGSTTDALLYHPLSDSWDLDNKYDAQKRSQSSVKPATSAPQVVSIGSQSVSVAADGSIQTVAKVTPVTNTTPSPAPNPPATPVQAASNVRDLWNQLFNSQPSLFPRR